MDLNRYSQGFADSLFSRHPHWQRFAQSTPEEEGNGNSLLVTLQVPAGHELWLSTDRDELTVGLEPFHTHFDDPLEALNFVDDLLAERAIVVVFLSNGEPRGGMVFSPEELAAEQLEPPYLVMSCNGTFDRSAT